ncbi:hypothetical protein [Saccharothrix lopnurensis]|uniref:Uncharacterized protein n=1 Tax=Saccharothrix lopnurensis TaxID=1670621 RepID=A0ABW1P607_9PSEU
MLPALATVAALERRIGVEVGTLEGADLGRAETDLEDASNLVRAETGNDWIGDDGTPAAPAPLVTVVLRAARRCYRNPDEFSSESEEGYTWRRDEDAVSPYLTQSEVSICQRYAGASSGLHTIATTRRDPRRLRYDVLLLPTSHGGDPLPAYDPDDVGW